VKRTVICLTLAALALSALPAPAQPAPGQVRAAVRERVSARSMLYQQGREEQVDRQTRTLKLGTDGELSLANIAGDIVITRGNGGDATLEIVKTARARTADEARSMLGLVDVTVTERAGRAEVKTVYPGGDEGRRENRRNMNVSVALTVTAPAGTRISANSVSGNVRVADIKGELSVNTVSGSVNVANAGRVESAKSVSGNVEVTDSQMDGGLEAQSVSGNVTLRKVSARRVEAGSISGNVVAQDIQSDHVQAHTISGNVEYSGNLAKSGRYEFNSHSGDVRITVGGNIGFELEASSFSGSVRSELLLTGQTRDDGDGPRNRRSLRGVFGDGSAVLNVTTFSGTVVVSKR
jgi:hypothetical protein